MSKKLLIGAAVAAGLVMLGSGWPTLAAWLVLAGLLAWCVRVIYFIGYASGFESGVRFGQELCDTAPDYRWDTPEVAKSSQPAPPEEPDPSTAFRQSIARYQAPAVVQDIHS